MGGSLLFFVTGSFLLVSTGIRHLTCSISTHLTSSRQFSAKPWYFSSQILKNIDFFIISLSLPIGVVAEIYSYFTWNGTSTVAVSYLNQAALLFAFWMILILIITTRNAETLPFVTELIFLLFGFVFALESLVVQKGVSGLELAWYNFLSLTSLVCAGSSFLLAFNPGFFLAEIALGGGFLLQGTWILQTGLSLFVPLFMSVGCHRLSEMPVNGESAVQCTLEEESARALAFIDFIFICHSLAVLIFTLVIYFIAAWTHNGKREGNYAPINVESNSLQMQQLAKFDID